MPFTDESSDTSLSSLAKEMIMKRTAIAKTLIIAVAGALALGIAPNAKAGSG
jgi:hypothetical protein